MLVRAKESVVELFCEHCQTVEPVKNGLTPTGFLRKFNAFRRHHDQQCRYVAERDVAIEKSIKATDNVIKSVSGIDVAPDIKGTRVDPYYDRAKAVVLEHRRASISLVQRHLQIGYNHAARLVDSMEGDILGKPGPQGIRPILPQNSTCGEH